MNDVEILRQLRDAYQRQEVSAIVGSGFTKNAYPDAPDWKGMLTELIEKAYAEDMKDRTVDYFLNRDGYDGVVGTFIKKMGMREALDVYIEQKTPYIERQEDGFRVVNSGKIITKDDMTTHRMMLNCHWKNVFTTNYDNFLESASEMFGLGYVKVTKDYELQHQSNKLIVKLHGDLVNFNRTVDEPFEFDSDRSRRYVASRDDYETYEEQHNAFSIYVKSMLLTGSFLAIGFSGDDPNFRSWVKWAMDVIDKNPKADPTDKKVYLIAFVDETLKPEQELYYKRHHIGMVRLFNDNVKKELGVAAGEETNVRKDLIQQLLRYLDTHADDGIEGKKVIGNSYNGAMGGLMSSLRDGKPLANDIQSVSQALSETPYPKTAMFNENVVDHFVFKHKGELNKEQTDAFVLAMIDSGNMPVSLPKSIHLNIDAAGYGEWERFLTREQTLSGAEELLDGNDDATVFENALRLLYNLKIAAAKELLTRWEPNGTWKLRKIALNGLFVKKESQLEQLKAYISGESSKQLRYFATYLYNAFNPWSKPGLSLQEYKKDGIDGFRDVCLYLLKEVKKTKDDLPVYGESITYIFYGDELATNSRSAQRLLNLYADTGFQFNYGGSLTIGLKEWYPAFKLLMTKYPKACLFYSCQFGSSKELQRIGEDYAFSDEIQPQLPSILNHCLCALTDEEVPLQLYKGLLQASAEMYVAVDEFLWYDNWMKVVKKYYVGDKDQWLYSTELRNNVKRACAYLKNPRHISATLTVMLEVCKKDPEHISQMFPGYLRLRFLKELTKGQQNTIRQIVTQTPISKCLFVLRQLDYHHLLAGEVCRMVIDKPSFREELSQLAPINLYTLANIVVGYQDAMHIVKQEILSRNVWHNGIDGKWASDPSFVPVGALPTEYTWTDEEKRVLWAGLSQNLRALKESRVIKDMYFKSSCVSLLSEMLNFAEDNPSCESDAVTIEEIQSLLAYARGWGDIEDGLCSPNMEIVEQALEELSIRIRKNGFKGEDGLVNMTIDHVLIHHENVPTAAVNLLSFIAYKGADYYLQKEDVRNKLHKVLEIYRGKDLREYNLMVVQAYHSFIDIAQGLRSVGMTSETIRWWLDEKRLRRFNFRERYVE